MTDILKVLGQGYPAAATDTLLYTAPALSSVTVSTLVLCNKSVSQITFRVRVQVSGDGILDKQYLFYDAPLGANSTLTITLGITLAEADGIYIYTSALGLSANMFGVETV